MSIPSAPAAGDCPLSRLADLRERIDKTSRLVAAADGYPVQAGRIDVKVAAWFPDYIEWELANPEITKEALMGDRIFHPDDTGEAGPHFRPEEIDLEREPAREWSVHDEAARRYRQHIERELAGSLALVDRAAARLQEARKWPELPEPDWSRMAFADGFFRTGGRPAFPAGFKMMYHQRRSRGWARDRRPPARRASRPGGAVIRPLYRGRVIVEKRRHGIISVRDFIAMPRMHRKTGDNHASSLVIMKTHLILVSLLLVTTLCAQWSVLEDDPRPRDPSRLFEVFSREDWDKSNFAAEEDLERFRDAKYGMFVHFGLSTYKNAELSWGVCKVRKAPDTGSGPYPTEEWTSWKDEFHLPDFDAKTLVRHAQDAGMRYIVVVAKHHDGFHMWDTAHSEFKVTNTPFGRDFLKEVADATREAGMKFGIYYSQRDWFHPDYAPTEPDSDRHKRYLEYQFAAVRELCTNYGKIDVFWFDAVWWGGMFNADMWDAENLTRMIRELQPGILINNRTSLPGDFDTPEHRIGMFQNHRPWESCMTVCRTWSYSETPAKTPEQIVGMLVGTLTGDGNILLSWGPKWSGEFAADQVEALKGAGEWVKKNQAAIFGTRGGPWMPSGWGGSVHRGETVYLHVKSIPASGRLELEGLEQNVLRAGIHLGTAIPFTQDGGHLMISIPPAVRDPLCTVIELTLDTPVTGTIPATPEPKPRILWYDSPAEDWQRHPLPLGNGSLGCMIFGGTEKERIQFNHDTLWIGGESNTGAYQAFGELFIQLGHEDPTNYRRELDISRAIHTVTYKHDGKTFTREAFASAPAGVIVIRLTADAPAAHTGSITLTDAHDAKIAAAGNRLTATGTTAKHQKYLNHTWEYPIVLQKESQVLVLNHGGTVEAGEGTITFRDCDSLTILLSAGTDYIADRAQSWTRTHPHVRNTMVLDAATSTPYESLRDAHIRDYQSLFNRLTLTLGPPDLEKSEQPTSARIAAYRGGFQGPSTKTIYEADAVGGQGEPDIGLEELLFHYARYLLISCSRPGTLPANLQGLWNESNAPEWRCDYHTDVNLQMNYWFSGPANLADCFLPFADWLHSILEVRKEETRAALDKPGFAMRVENGIFGGGSYRWSIGDASWLANNIWDHYRFTKDHDYLTNRAYPVLRALFDFWEAHLIEIPAPTGEGTVLVSPDGWSPEHGPTENGVSFEQQLAWDLLGNFAEAAAILDTDAAEREKALEMRARLLGPQIGRWGQLQEWMVDRDDPENKHRHLSHLVAVHPGRQISPCTTPELAEAARVSMNARGDGATGWSKAWKINMWARLHDGDRAYKLLNEMVRGNIYDNLLCAHPPFQIDGNFGYAAGVCEMLLQSHMDFIHLLPALPAAWPDGKATGLRARGGFELDLEWKSGVFAKATLRSTHGGPCTLRPGGPVKITRNDAPVATGLLENGHITFATEAGAEYLITAETE